MIDKAKIEGRIKEIDAVITEQQNIFNQAQANLLALSGAKNELVRLLQLEKESENHELRENVVATNDQG